MLQYAVGDLIPQRRRRWVRRETLDDLQLDLHPLRADAFDVHGHVISRRKPLPGVRKARQVGRQLNKAAVLFHAADDAPHRLAGREPAGVFHPGAQQLLVGHGQAMFLLIGGEHCGQDFLSHLEAVLRVGDPGHRDLLNGQHGHHAAAHIQKRAEGRKMRHSGRYHRPRRELQQCVQRLLLRYLSGKTGHRRTFLIAFQGSNCKAYLLSNL